MRHDKRYRTAGGEILESLPGKNNSVCFRGTPAINTGDILTDTYQQGQSFIVRTAATETMPGRQYRVVTLVAVTHYATVTRLDTTVENEFGRSLGDFRIVAVDVPLSLIKTRARQAGIGSNNLWEILFFTPDSSKVSECDRITLGDGDVFTVESINNSSPGLLSLLVFQT